MCAGRRLGAPQPVSVVNINTEIQRDVARQEVSLSAFQFQKCSDDQSDRCLDFRLSDYWKKSIVEEIAMERVQRPIWLR